VLARQALSPLSHTTNPFSLQLFFEQNLGVYAQAGLDQDPPIYPSCTVEMTGMYYSAQLFIGLDGEGCLTVPGLASSHCLPDLHLLSS
jgi:hypothetical protein